MTLESGKQIAIAFGQFELAQQRWAASTRSHIEFPREDIEGSIPARFEQMVRRYPDHPAIQIDDRTITFAELNRRANQLAHALIAQFGTECEPVALLLPQGHAAIVGIIGTLKAGKIFAAMDPSINPESRLLTMLDDLQTRVLVTDSEHHPLSVRLARSGRARPTTIVELEQLDPTIATSDLGLSIPPETPSMISYTSGSTGQPKGVVRNHRFVLHSGWANNHYFLFCPDDRQALFQSYSFIWTTGSIFNTLLNGALTAFYDVKIRGVLPLADWLIRNQITIMRAGPAILRQLFERLPDPDKRRFPRLRLVYMGSESATRQDVLLWQQHFSSECMLSYSLSSSEAGILTRWLFDKHSVIPEGPLTVGYPMPDVEITLVNEDGTVAQAGQVGEIVAKSRHLMTGCWRKPELTRTVLIPDPEGSDRCIYSTGDMGRLRADGSLEMVGRKDFQVKIRGYTVQINEVEMALLDTLLFKEVAVVARSGQADTNHLVAYLVPKELPSPSVRDLRTALKSRLADYMIPSTFVFVDTLPRISNGKVDRNALPAPEQTRPAVGNPFVAPRNRFELDLVNIWEENLGIYPVGVLDHFFDLGGDSLMAENMLLELGKKFGRSFPSRVLYEASTVEQLAALLQKEGWQPKWSSLVAVQPKGSRTPLLCFPPLNAALAFRNLANYLDRDQPVFSFLASPSGDRNPFARIEDEAAHYLEQIRSVQNAGPYCLAGWSYGGMVAFEVAQQLVAQGQGIAFLGILDIGFDLRDLNSRLTYLGRRLRYIWKLGLRGQLQRASSRAHRSPSWPAPAAALKQEIPLPAPDNDYRGDWTRGRHYRPKPYKGQVTLFRTRHDDYAHLFRDPLMGWQRLALGGLQVYDIVGEHGNMMIEPNVRDLADKLGTSLAQAQRQTARE